MQIKVIYTGDIDMELDDKIRKAIESIEGVKWYAQGTSATGNRDICFDYKDVEGMPLPCPTCG